MNQAYRDYIATQGAAEVSHIGLVDGENQPVGDGRKEVTWTATNDGLIRPDDDIVYAVDEGDDVAGWQGYNAAEGGVAYGINPVTPRNFSNPGTYTLKADQTSIQHNAAS